MLWLMSCRELLHALPRATQLAHAARRSGQALPLPTLRAEGSGLDLTPRARGHRCRVTERQGRSAGWAGAGQAAGCGHACPDPVLPGFDETLMVLFHLTLLALGRGAVGAFGRWGDWTHPRFCPGHVATS